MAEYIGRTELKERIRYDFDYSLQLCEDIIEVIDSLPTIDIVRCSECKWHTPIQCEYYPIEHNKESYWCSLLDIYTPKDFFCANRGE